MREASTQANKFVLDASAFLKSVFADEEGHDQALALTKDHAFGMIELIAPTLLSYEVVNGLLQALRGKRPMRSLKEEEAKRILNGLEELRILTESVDSIRLLQVAQAHQITAYDAAYVALAEQEGVSLITGDKKLYNAVRDKLPPVTWIEEYLPQVKEEPEEETE